MTFQRNIANVCALHIVQLDCSIFDMLRLYSLLILRVFLLFLSFLMIKYV